MDYGVSVIMSVYNGEALLEKSIKRILSQTYKKIEFIIIDDGSVDDSWSIITNYKNLDKRIIAVKQENIGLTRSLNKGIQIAKFSYIARQDADDISYPKRIEMQVDWFGRNKDAVLCGTLAKKKIDGRLKKFNITPLNHKEIIKALKFKNVFNHSSVMFKKFINNKCVYYNEKLIFAQDYELWSRLSSLGQVCNLNKFLIELNVGENNLSERFRKNQRLTAVAIALSNNYHEIKNKLNENIDEQLIKDLSKNNKYKELLQILVYIYNIEISNYSMGTKKILQKHGLFFLKNFNQLKYHVLKNLIRKNGIFRNNMHVR